MKREDIYEGMSGIGPDLIEEAEKHVFAARRKPKIFRWAAAAAVFVLLCGVGVYGATGGFTVRKLLINGYEVRANISRIPMQEITGVPLLMHRSMMSSLLETVSMQSAT